MFRLNPSKYMFYSNILTGKFDYHIPEGSSAHLQKMGEKLHRASGSCGAFAYGVETIACFADALAAKVELGHRLYRAYHEGDRSAIKEIAEGAIPGAIEKIKTFKVALRKQWMQENKSFGFDVLSLRIGGLIAQMEDAILTLKAWLNGEISHIEELEQPRLPYTEDGKDGERLLTLNRWERMAGQNLSNMFGVR